MGNKVKFIERPETKYLVFKCPGCGYEHVFVISSTEYTDVWRWNGSLVKPTLAPSLLNTIPNKNKVCHLFVEDGQIRYMADCTHELAGKTVDMEDINECVFK